MRAPARTVMAIAASSWAACAEPESPIDVEPPARTSGVAGSTGAETPGTMLGDPAEVASIDAVGPPNTRADVLIGRGSAWRYRDDGVDLGAAWAAADGGAWAVADAPLGYGEAALATTIAPARPNTVYLRRSFRLWSPEVERLYLRLLVDDGAIVYLNGHEVARVALPATGVGFDTPAAPREIGERYLVLDLSAGLATSPAQGENELAIEVHQAPGPRDDLVFDAELVAWVGRGWMASSAFDVPRGSPWAFWTDGAALGAGWHSSYVNSDPWSTGPAPLGHGAREVVTDVGEPEITTYFLHRFERDRPVAGMHADILCSGGFIVYLNGEEILRRGLPPGPIDRSTPGVAPPTRGYQRFDLDALVPQLTAGDNLLAVEVHAPSAGAPIVFDLELAYDATWRPRATIPGERLVDLAFWDAQRGLAIGERGAARRTTDGGATWRAQGVGTAVDLRALDLVVGGTGWLVGNDGVARVTRDFGATWAAAGPATVRWLVDVDFVDAQRGWILDGETIFRTTDGGATWTPITPPTGGWRLAFVDADHGWFAGSAWAPDWNESLPAIYRTDDGGLTWTLQWASNYHPLTIDDLEATSPTSAWAVGRGMMTGAVEVKLFTEDGQHWSAAPSTSNRMGLNAITWLTRELGWAVGNGGSIVHTADGGHTWSAQRGGGFDLGVLDAVACADPSRCWAVGAGGGLLETSTGGVAVME